MELVRGRKKLAIRTQLPVLEQQVRMRKTEKTLSNMLNDVVRARVLAVKEKQSGKLTGERLKAVDAELEYLKVIVLSFLCVCVGVCVCVCVRVSVCARVCVCNCVGCRCMCRAGSVRRCAGCGTTVCDDQTTTRVGFCATAHQPTYANLQPSPHSTSPRHRSRRQSSAPS
jgi:hypothetical protein